MPGAAYRVTRARGADTLRGTADRTGTLVVGPFRGAPPLTGGDVLRLSNGRRVLTTLHVAHLVAVIYGEETVLGPGSRCQPGLYYGAPPSKPAPFSSVAGLTGENGATLTGRICPLSGSANGLPDAAVAQTDDRSGGLTETEVADISSTSPVDGETVYGRFTARAQAAFVGPHDQLISSPYPIALTITSASGGKPVIALNDVNTASGTPINEPEAGDLSRDLDLARFQRRRARDRHELRGGAGARIEGLDQRSGRAQGPLHARRWRCGRRGGTAPCTACRGSGAVSERAHDAAVLAHRLHSVASRLAAEAAVHRHAEIVQVP